MRHYYNIALQGARPIKPYSVEGLDTRYELVEEEGEPVEDLISIPLVDGNQKHMVQIRSNLDQIIKDQLTFFL